MSTSFVLLLAVTYVALVITICRFVSFNDHDDDE